MSRILSILIRLAGVMALAPAAAMAAAAPVARAGSRPDTALTQAPRPCLVLAFSEETLPAQDAAAPSPGTAPGTGSSPGAAASPAAAASGEWKSVPNTEDGASPNPPDAPAPPAAAANDGGATPAVTQPPDNSPPPALDVSKMTTGLDPSEAPLTGAIKDADNPAMAASLRQTEQARKQLADGKLDAALRSLGSAVSIDPGNSFGYFYLGRAYMERKNYEQALTFFKRAEIGFGSRPEWLGETIGNEGVCYEEMGQMSDAAKAYHDALASAPNNLMARAGYGRVGDQYPATTAANAPVEPEEASQPSSDEVAPPPDVAQPPPPPSNAPPVEELPPDAKPPPDSP